MNRMNLFLKLAVVLVLTVLGVLIVYWLPLEPSSPCVGHGCPGMSLEVWLGICVVSGGILYGWYLMGKHKFIELGFGTTTEEKRK